MKRAVFTGFFLVLKISAKMPAFLLPGKRTLEKLVIFTTNIFTVYSTNYTNSFSEFQTPLLALITDTLYQSTFLIFLPLQKIFQNFDVSFGT